MADNNAPVPVPIPAYAAPGLTPEERARAILTYFGDSLESPFASSQIEAVASAIRAAVSDAITATNLLLESQHTAQEQTVAVLTARNAALEEGLRPFADEGDRWHAGYDDNMSVQHRPIQTLGTVSHLTLGDCRRAAALLLQQLSEPGTADSQGEEPRP